MVGYIFRAENTVTKKIYIGKNPSVRFDKTYIGDNPGVLADAERYGRDKFIVNMIRACESIKDCNLVYDALLKEFGALTDEKYYNYVGNEEVAPAKKTRKKKVVEEE